LTGFAAVTPDVDACLHGLSAGVVERLLHRFDQLIAQVAHLPHPVFLAVWAADARVAAS
jgi:prephenate dehydrogenase